MVRKKSKFKKGEIVIWYDEKYKVKSVSYIAHPEHLIGKRAKSGWYATLEPIDPYAEEPSGWINQARIKKIRKRKR